MSLKEYLEANYSMTATRGYYNLIQLFLAFCYEPEKANYQDIMGYIQHLRERDLNPKTLRHHLFAVKIYYRYLLAVGLRNDHPCQQLYLKDKINRAIDIQSLYPMAYMQEFLDNYEAGKKNKFTEIREKALIGLLIYQGVTVLEISQLNVEDLDLEKGTILIPKNRNTNSRSLALKSNQILLLQRYINETRKGLLRKDKPTKALFLGYHGQRIYPNVINGLINYGRKKSEKLLPIKIRQSVILHLLKSGHNLRVVQVFIGHKRISSTEVYKQSDIEGLKGVIDRLHPLS